MIKRVAIGAVLLFLLVLFLPVFPPLVTQLAIRLPVGWVAFLGRVLPKVSVNWSGIGMVVASSALIVVGVQSFCGWVCERVGRVNPDEEPRRWLWRWTLSLYAGLWLLFLSIMGAVGVAHQVGWLLASREPVYVVRESLVSNLRQAALGLAIAGADEEWDAKRTRASFAGEGDVYYFDKRSALELFDLLLFENGEGKITAAVVFYRDPKKRAKSGLALIEVSTNDALPEIKYEREGALPEILARYDKNPKGNVD